MHAVCCSVQLLGLFLAFFGCYMRVNSLARLLDLNTRPIGTVFTEHVAPQDVHDYRARVMWPWEGRWPMFHLEVSIPVPSL